MRTYRIINILSGALMALSAPALLLSSCAKEGGNVGDATLSFSTDTPGIVEVKAAAVTSVTDFYTIGYAGTTQWFPESGSPQRVQLSGGSQTFSTYKWKMGDTKTFFAYSNNLPSGATASITNTGVTLAYTAIPTDASAQTDVMLGRYSGNGDNKGEAKMTFYHPLAQVVFKMGDMVGVSKIDKIEIKGVYNAGTTTLGTATTTTSVTSASGSGTTEIANFSWTGTSGSEKVSQTVNSLPSKGSEFGVPFMLIPQNLATQNVTVSVTVTSDYSNSPVVLTKKLDSGTFATGKKTVCTLTVNPDRELDCTLAAYTADNDDDIFKKELQPVSHITVIFGYSSTKAASTTNTLISWDPIDKANYYQYSFNSTQNDEPGDPQIAVSSLLSNEQSTDLVLVPSRTWFDPAVTEGLGEGPESSYEISDFGINLKYEFHIVAQIRDEEGNVISQSRETAFLIESPTTEYDYSVIY